MLIDDSKDSIISVYEIPNTGFEGLSASLFVAVRASEDSGFLAEFPTAKAVMIPPCILYRPELVKAGPNV